jgi:serine/threonine protein kinase
MTNDADRTNSHGGYPDAENPSDLPPGDSSWALRDAAREELSESSVRRLLERIVPGTMDDTVTGFVQPLADHPSCALPAGDSARSFDPYVAGSVTGPRSPALESTLDDRPVGVWGQSQDPGSGPGRYRILKTHGSGGLGVVYKALDAELHREVALKTVRSELSPESRRRFLREAEITAQLEHPGVVPIYGLGSDDRGHPYYAMRLVRGYTLKEAIDRFHQRHQAGSSARTSGEGRVQLLKLLERFMAVCNTVAYAHSHGIVHRDLKPSNIMLADFGETLILDWGLAKLVDRSELDSDTADRTLAPLPHYDELETLEGSVVGTPSFMSPEQATGLTNRIGPATDIYSLGTTLYTLLTGRVPFDRSDLSQILDRVQRGDFERPRRLNPKIPRPLEMICLKAMSLRIEDRYQSAKELADDVERWIAGEPVTASRESYLERPLRWTRRSRFALIPTLVLFVWASIAQAFLATNDKQQRRLAAELSQTVGSLAQAEDRLGAVCRGIGQTGEAARHYERARDAWQRLASGHPEVREYRLALDESRRQLESLSSKSSSAVPTPTPRRSNTRVASPKRGDGSPSNNSPR